MATDTDIEFRSSDLVGPAGTGSNGEKLVNSLLDHYPPDLQAAQLKRINPVLDDKLDEKAYAAVAKLVGVKHIEQVHVRGGHQNISDAVVTYAWLDQSGRPWKGCFPYEDLGSGKSDGHISQRDSLARSAVAQQHVREHPLPAGATGEQQAAEPQDPFDVLEGASAADLVQMMRDHPERASFIKTFERENRGETARKSVLEFETESESESGEESESESGSEEPALEPSASPPGARVTKATRATPPTL